MPIVAGSNVVSLIGAPTDIGASMRGASMGPEALRVAQTQADARKAWLEVLDHGNLSGPPNPWLPPVDGYRHLDEVVAWNRLVHEAMGAELAAGRLPILLGGDHCLAIGSISAVATLLPRTRQATPRTLARRPRGLQHQRTDAERQPARHAGRVPVRPRAAVR